MQQLEEPPIATASHIRSRLADVDVAIVGAGFSGSLLAARLAHLERSPSIALIDGAGAFGTGVAYSTASLKHLLNVPAGKMSAYPETPDHFLTWLRDNRRSFSRIIDRDWQPADFVPRSLYGAYLRAILESAPLDGADISVVVRSAVDLTVDEHGATIWFADRTRIRARVCILATGNAAPRDIPGISDTLRRSEHYIGNPWGHDLAARTRYASTVMLIGSGLTAVDAALAVRAANPGAAIHMISRHGHLPHAHRASAPYSIDLSALAGTRSIRDLLHRVRAAIREAEAHGADWRSVIDALRPHTQAIWRGLDAASRRRFLRHVRAYWEIHRHRIAPAVHSELRDMSAAGALTVHAGRIVSSFDRPSHAAVSYRSRRNGSYATIKAEIVVNCTGPDTDVTRSDSALWRNLVSRNIVRPDSLRLGIETDARGAVLDVMRRPSARLFAIGGLRRPALYESTAVPELRQQARDLVEQLRSAGVEAVALA